MVCTGAKDELRARLASHKYVRLLRVAGFDVKFCSFKIQNLVASTELNFLLKLDELSNDYGACAGYEPDLFPGLIMRIQNPKVVYLFFRSGRIVITGARSREIIQTSFNDIYNNILLNYIDNDNTVSNSAVYRHECNHKRMRMD